MKKPRHLLLFFAFYSLFVLSAYALSPHTSPSTAAAAPSLFEQMVDPVTGRIMTGTEAAVTSRPSASLSPTVWTKHPGNPVLQPGAPASWDGTDVTLPSVLNRADEYEMWYAGSGPSIPTLAIGYASSADGISWDKSPANPVLAPGGNGAWDSGYVNAPHVIFHDGQYKMWFRGTENPSTSAGASIGYATSPDGLTWTKHAANPVLTPGPSGSWDSGRIWSADVLVSDNVYKMWYSAVDATSQSAEIGYATSPDGVNWTKHSGNPILSPGPSESWDSRFIYYPCVFIAGSTYHMWYAGYDGSEFAIGYATSSDGITWDKHDGNPVLVPGSAASWDSAVVIDPAVVVQLDQYQMWYSGRDGAGTERIGYATADRELSLDKLVYLPITTR